MRALLVPFLAWPLFAAAVRAEPEPSGPSTVTATATPAPTSTSGTTTDSLFAEALRAYHAALLARRLGQTEIRREDIGARVAEAENLVASGRVDEAIARLVEIVENAQFDLFARTEEGRAAVFRLGDALATAGIAEPARGYLRRLVDANDAWIGYGSAQLWARRAVRRLVDIALDTAAFDQGARDVQNVPPSASEEVRGEIAYMNGHAEEAAGHPDAELAA